MSDIDRGKPACPQCGATALYKVTPRAFTGEQPFYVCPGGHSWRTADRLRLPSQARPDETQG